MMKKGEIILLILAVIGVLFFSGCASEPATNIQQPAVSAKVLATGCAWRPESAFPFGSCEAVVGAYFDGTSCVTMSGCPAEAEGKIPFKSMEECQNACMKADPVEKKQEENTVKEFKIEAKQFEFVPGTITVNEGDTVRLIVTSADVEHGVGIPEFNVNLKVPGGKTETVEFVADKKGTYAMQCSVFCGSGHKNMKGTLIVK